MLHRVQKEIKDFLPWAVTQWHPGSSAKANVRKGREEKRTWNPEFCQGRGVCCWCTSLITEITFSPENPKCKDFMAKLDPREKHASCGAAVLLGTVQLGTVQPRVPSCLIPLGCILLLPSDL